jgi:hypothetical protein
MKEIIAKFAPQNFNDLLALGSLVIIPLMWLLPSRFGLVMPPEVNGALIVTWSLIFQFYFRKSKTEV